ncbi:MAG: hypothetical protein ACIAQZ_14560 [Sedimentisphaeraceae bacterium JB056]
MKISMQCGENEGDLHFSGWDHAISGVSVDDRGRSAIKFCEDKCVNTHKLEYCPNSLRIFFDDKTYCAEDIEELIEGLGEGSILLETTTLGFVEIFLACRAIKGMSRKKTTLLYMEPQDYTKDPHKRYVLSKRDFELSDEIKGFVGIPYATYMLRKGISTKALFLLGYEGDRLRQAFESLEIQPSMCSFVYGVPAFHPGWEMNSFANSVSILQEKNAGRNILYSGAQNPKVAYNVIEKIYKSCDPSNRERLLISPIGTKPHAIGAALFACEHEDVALVYDFPSKKTGRSSKTSKWHLFDIDFGAVDEEI